jgi:hypothetical protein
MVISHLSGFWKKSHLVVRSPKGGLQMTILIDNDTFFGYFSQQKKVEKDMFFY